MCATSAEKQSSASFVERLVSNLATARSWALCLVGAGLLLKIVWIGWCVADGAIRLSGWEWAALPFVGSYQHLLLGLVSFALYFVILIPSVFIGALRGVSLAVMSGVQLLAVFYFMTALRMSLLLGTPPTPGLLQAGADGGVLGATLFQAENLPYTIVGALLSVLTVIGSAVVNRRWTRWPRFPKLGLALGAIALWVSIGAIATANVHSELHHAHTEPMSFFVFELFEERAEREAPVVEHNPEAFQTRLIYGQSENERTGHLFQNLDAWRRTRRNVVLIVLESVAARNASYAGPVTVGGEVRDTTPNLAALRDHMLIMENHYAVHSTSMEDLFSIACSLYPYPLRPVITDVNPGIPCGSMPETLTEAGYSAGLFHSGHFSFWRKELFFENRGFEVMVDADTMPGREGAYEYSWGIDERVTTEAISEFIRSHSNQSFFVEYIPVFPHAPYQVPSEDMEFFQGGERIDDYHNSLRYVDGAIGTIIDTLREENLLDDTLLMVVADHGEAFDEHPGNRCHSAFIYEENIHVPFGIHNPILFAGAPSITRVTNHLDMLPTVADMLDLPRGQAWQGRSLREDGRSRLIYFYSVSGRQLVGLRDGRYKVIWNRTARALEIFDLVEDPGERQDLSESLSDRIGPYQRALSGWRAYQLALIPRFGMQAEEDDGLRWLADLRPSRSYQPHPYDPVADHSVAGRDLQVDWISYRRGLGTHSDSWYTYDIGSVDALRLVGRVGRDRRMIRGELHAYIFLDGRLAFSSGSMVAGTPAVGFDLDVDGVHEVTFVSWKGDESGRGDHVNWVDLHLVTAPERVYRPMDIVWLDELRPSGANNPGRELHPIPSLPHGRLRTSDERISRGLVVPPGALVHYDLRSLGATEVTGRLLPEGYEGEGYPPELVELFLDEEMVWRGSPNQMREVEAFEIAVPPSARLFSIRVSEADETAPMVVLTDLAVATEEEAFFEGRRFMAETDPRVWSLTLIPPMPPSPSIYEVGWSRTIDGSWIEIDGLEEPESMWLRPGARVRFDLRGLSASRLQSMVAVQGPPQCRVIGTVLGNVEGDARSEDLWQSEPLVPGERPVFFETALGPNDRLTLEAHAEGDDPGDCLLIWGNPTLLPNQ